MTIKAVLFDFDGTLADTLPLSFYAFKYVFKKYDDRDVTIDELIAMFGPTEDDIIAGNLRAKENVQHAISDYYSIYENSHAAVQMSDDMFQLLTYLKTNDIRMGIITGKSRKAYEISSKAMNLTSFFDIVVTGDDVQQPKPHPEGIEKSLNFLGISKSEAVFVGDSNADIKAGKAAGLRTYGVQWLSTYQSTHFEIEPDRIFTSVEQFLELLKNEKNQSLKWLDWAKQIQAIAQAGLTYSKDVYDLERFQALRDISVEILDSHTKVSKEKTT